MKKTLSILLVIFLLLIPFSIYADSQTYISIPTEYTEYTYENTTMYMQNEGISGYNIEDVRTVVVGTATYFISQYAHQKVLLKSGNATVHPELSYTQTYNGITYYYVDEYGGNPYANVKTVLTGLLGSKSNVDGLNGIKTAIYYTFGEGAVGEEPFINWGLLNIRFNTDISGSGDRSGENLDNIMWTSWDSNGNYIGDLQIEIRAVPGYYEANDRLSLLQMQFINWVKNTNLSVQVFKGSIVPEHRSFSWNYIAGLFSSIKTWQGRFWSIFASDNYWYQYGWIYEARILDNDDTPISEWQEIVTGTASSPNDTEIIETSDELTPELYNVIYNINVYNDYQDNWQINNTTINMQPDETLDNDKPWWVVLLEGILSILDKLLELLMKLFIPESLTLPDFTNQTNQYMNNTGIFGQSIQFINDTHTTFQSIQNADPVISVPAITYDNTTLIPAQSWNLNTLVDDYGLSNLHNMVYLVTDGFVYIGLIILIRRKVIEVLKK